MIDVLQSMVSVVIVVVLVCPSYMHPCLHTWTCYFPLLFPPFKVFTKFSIFVQNRAEVDIRNNRRQTPLLLAVSQGHTPLIELLVHEKANINVHDEDGDTCLHLALMRQTVAEKDASPMLDSVGIFPYISSLSKNHERFTEVQLFFILIKLFCQILFEGCCVGSSQIRREPVQFTCVN